MHLKFFTLNCCFGRFFIKSLDRVIFQLKSKSKCKKSSNFHHFLRFFPKNFRLHNVIWLFNVVSIQLSICEAILLDILQSLWCRRGLAPAGIFREGEARSTKGGLVRGVAAWGVQGGQPSDVWEVFKKVVKNQWKIYNLYKKISRKFSDFSNFEKMLSLFCRKNGKKIWKSAFVGG